MDVINRVADLIDELAMKVYDDYVANNNKISYLESLTIALEFINGEDYKYSDKSLIETYKLLSDIKINEEDLRKALFFEEIKAFKHLNLSLDAITPDAVCMIIACIMKRFKNMNVLDLGIGLGNLSVILKHYLDVDFNLIGIEQSEVLCNYLKAKANFLQIPMEIHFQDTLDMNYQNIDAIIADVDNYQYENEYYSSALYDLGVRDYDYLLIEKHLDSGNPDALSYYIVESDFFSRCDSKTFREVFIKKAYFKAIITLPTSFNKNKQKIILVVKKKKENENVSTTVFNIPEIKNNKDINKLLINIRNTMES